MKTDVQVQAVLGEKTLPLDEILNWEVGTNIVFNTHPDDLVEVRCGEVPMFIAKTGQKKDKVAVQIEKYIPPKQEEG